MKNKMKKTLLLSALMMASAGITACAEKIAPEDAVKQRAEARWQLRIDGKIDELYDYLSPAKRQVVSKKQYLASFGNAVTYLNAQVEDVTCKDNEETKIKTCMAKIMVELKTGMGASMIQVKKMQSETWVYQDKQWWVAQ